MKRYAPFAFALLLLCALLAHAWLWLNPDGTLKNTTWTPPLPVPVQLSDASQSATTNLQLETSQLLTVSERPLFSKTRRPPPPPPPPPAPAAPDIFSTAQLKGVFQSEQQTGIIMQVNGKSRRLRINDNLDGWTFKSVQGSTATFESNGSQRVITLKKTPSARAP